MALQRSVVGGTESAAGASGPARGTGASSGMSNRRDFITNAIGLTSAIALGGRTALASGTSPEASPSEALSFDPWLEIDSATLADNVAAMSRMAGGRPVVAVVKNNAYGLGLGSAGPVLDRIAGVSALAVVRPDEALALRRAGTRKPILLMGPASEEELLELVPLDVIQSPYRPEAPALLTRVSQRLRRPVRAHLYVDTGMHRMGMPVADALPWIAVLARSGAVRIEGAFTELVEDADFDAGQARRLSDLKAQAKAAGIDIGTLHAASTDAVQHHTTTTFLDALRPGLGLYGGYVSERAMKEGGFRVAYRMKARVIRVDRLAAGEGVSYHRRWTTDKPTWIATLAIGHVDGYPSTAIKGCEVLVRGRLFPVIGYVSASHTILHLGDEPAAQVGDEATLVGPDHPALHPNEIARRSGYSEYNMFMHLSPQLKRVVI